VWVRRLKKRKPIRGKRGRGRRKAKDFGEQGVEFVGWDAFMVEEEKPVAG